MKADLSMEIYGTFQQTLSISYPNVRLKLKWLKSTENEKKTMSNGKQLPIENNIKT